MSLNRILNHPQTTPASRAKIDGQPSSPADSYYYAKPQVPEHKEHPHCPSSLHCLRDTDGRPPHTLPVILRCTILGSPNKKLTIREIYAAMENKYPWYKTAGNAWKQSVRHHLSLNLLFEREPRPVTDPGVGSYWTVNLNAPPGTKRPRKRGRKDANDESDPAPPPRKRGRPRKYPEQEPMVFDQPPMTMMLVPVTDGYPPGCQLPTWSARDGSSTRTSAGEPSAYGDDDEVVYSDVPMDDHRVSDGDFDDNEEEDPSDRQSPYLLRPVSSSSDPGRDSRPSRNQSLPSHNSPPRLAGQQTQQPQPSPHHHHHVRRPSPSSNGTSAYTDYDTRDESDHRSIIDRLQREVQNLRQQSADAVSVSVKMSDQLAEAHAEASRVRAALRSMENKYEESERRRKEAERIVDQQQRLRQIAETSLQDRRRH